MKQIRNYDDGRVTLERKMKIIENSRNIILSCVYRTLSLVSTGYEKVSLFNQLKLGGYSERAMKIALVAWVAHKAGMQCSVRSSSLATIPYSMKNLITCFQLSPDV